MADGGGDSPRDLQPSDFETPCEACGGIAWDGEQDRPLCEACGGTGAIPTALGQGIDQVLRQELLRMIEDGSWDALRADP
jgi:hypothetical protein